MHYPNNQRLILTHQQQNIRKNVHKTIRSLATQSSIGHKTTILCTNPKENLSLKIPSLYIESSHAGMMQKNQNKNSVFKAKQLGHERLNQLAFCCAGAQSDNIRAKYFTHKRSLQTNSDPRAKNLPVLCSIAKCTPKQNFDIFRIKPNLSHFAIEATGCLINSFNRRAEGCL